MITPNRAFYDHIFYDVNGAKYVIFFLKFCDERNEALMFDLTFLPLIGSLIQVDPSYQYNLNYFSIKSNLSFETDAETMKYFAGFEATRLGYVGPVAHTIAGLVAETMGKITRDSYKYFSNRFKKLAMNIREPLIDCSSDIKNKICPACHSQTLERNEFGEYACCQCDLTFYYDEHLKKCTINGKDALELIRITRSTDMLSL